jgi:CRP/FNR family transcriptional regulator, cyclic AMP receptor protein
MNTDDLQVLEEVGAEAVIASGQVLIEPGQEGAGLYVVLEGTVAVETPETTRQLGPGEVIGELALFSADGKRTARVRAITDVRVLAVDRLQVERLCAGDEAFAHRLRNVTAVRNEAS